MTRVIPFVNLQKQYLDNKVEIINAINRVLESGCYILGDEVVEFESQFAKLCNVPKAFGVANGTDALIIALKTLGIGEGDEVITAPNSWISSASTIALVGATPVFVDTADDLNIDVSLIEEKITEKTRAILPVHLTGRPAHMDAICSIARRNNLFVAEDSAQAVGASYKGRPCGSIGDIGCFSLHPLKNLNCCGDAGIITSGNSEFFPQLELFGKHGMSDRNTVEFWGYNSRIDSIQAAILNVRLKYLDDITKKRRNNASIYQERLSGIVDTPKDDDSNITHVYHLYVIQCEKRDELKMFLESNGVNTAIHYPVPIHLQPAAQYLGYQKGDLPIVERQASRILSLPVSEVIPQDDIHRVSDLICKFYGK